MSGVKDLVPVAKRVADTVWTATLRDSVYGRLSARDCSLNVKDIEALDVRTEIISLDDHPICAVSQDGLEDYVSYMKEPCGHAHRRKIGVHVTHDARVAYPGGILSSREGIVMDAYANHSVLKNPKYAVPQLTLGARAVTARHKTGFLLYTAWSHNFFQWMTNALTRLTFLDAVPKDVPIVVYKGAPAFARHSLDYLDPDREILWAGDGVHLFETLYVPSNIADAAMVADAAISYLRGPWRAALEPHRSVTQSPGQRLYISRKDAPSRRIANEDEVERYLGTLGFRSVVMSEHSVADQAELFAKAECIVGSHGAAFINLVHAEPGARALEIFRRGHRSRSFYSIAAKRDLVYGMMLADADLRGDLIVDMDVLSRTLDLMFVADPPLQPQTKIT